MSVLCFKPGGGNRLPGKIGFADRGDEDILAQQILIVCGRFPINESHRFMGEDDQHVKLFADGFSLVGFSLAEKYVELGLPNRLSAYGYLKANCFRGKKYKEIALLDIGAQ